jgi:hypothetical protein
VTYDELKSQLDRLGCDSAEILRGIEPEDQEGIDAIAFFAARVVR